MNILTFDIEEWYVEKAFGGGRAYKYQQYNSLLSMVMDELDKLGICATFFCVGQLAKEFPEVVKTIVSRGHEVGCHSNVHTWLNKMDEESLMQDTTEALKALEDVSGQKVVSYRAPAFSITPNNKWAVNVLAECGIQNDASIFPTSRDFGGFKGFPQDKPCVVSCQDKTLKEYPISLTTVLGKTMAYSGGGYFRLLPYWLVNRKMKKRDYNICYFHLSDMITEKRKIMSKVSYEEYFKEPGTLKNRLVRYVKANSGIGNTYEKLTRLLSEHEFVNIKEADKRINWNQVMTVSL